jgi:RimJ/RimL family protein N-acetyltransferase
MALHGTLTGARIILEPLHTIEPAVYYTLLSDLEGARFTGTQRSFTLDDGARWLATLADRDDRVDCAIITREHRRFIGEVVLNNIDPINRSANLRIGLLAEATNRGYGSEALQLLIQYGFETLRLHRIELAVFAFNSRALHVYEKLGFRQEGRRREVLYWDGSYYDSIDMSILEDEYGAQATLHKP